LSSSGTISASVVSPTTIRVAVSGRSQSGGIGQIGAGQAGHRRPRAAAGERDGIRMPLPYSSGGSTRMRGPVRAGLLLLDAGDPGGLDPVDLALVEARRSMSAYRSSDGSRFSFSADRYTLLPSSEALALTTAPSDSTALAKASESSGPAPSSSMLMVKLAVPGLRPVGGRAARELVAELHHRDLVALGQDHLGAVLQRGALQRRELQLGNCVGTCALLRSTVLASTCTWGPPPAA
jgi:hypothetical protein